MHANLTILDVAYWGTALIFGQFTDQEGYGEQYLIDVNLMMDRSVEAALR